MEIYSDKKRISKKRRILRIKIYFAFLLLALLVFGFYYLLTFSSVFQIKDILITNNKFLTNEEILTSLKQKVLSTSFGGQAGFENLLAWPSGEIKISNPAILNVNIEKEWFKRNIIVQVNERGRFAIWCNSQASNCYWIDKEGYVFADAPVTEGSLVFTIFDTSNENLFPGSRVEEDRFVGNLISILENFYKTEFEVKKITSDSALKEIHIETVEGPTFIFSTRIDSSKNLSLIKDLDLKKVEYIDLTVDDKIFYKNK